MFFYDINNKKYSLVLYAPLKIYAPKISYYDLIGGNFALLDDCLFNHYSDYDVNKLQEQYKFEYIFVSKFTQKAQDCDVKRFILDEKYNKDYEKVDTNLYVRK